MNDERVRRRVKVRGRVQGVFFRDSARQLAWANGVAGWVRNCPDGDLEAVLEGPRDAVERVVRFFHTGPKSARVEDVEVHDEQPQGLSRFDVR